MKDIKLTNGGVTWVNDEDFDRVSDRSWCKSTRGYVVSVVYLGQGSNGTKNEVIYLHRFIINAGPGSIVDHVNGNKLDNTKNNLRFVTQSENIINARLRLDNSSGAKGVGWNKALGKWHASIRRNGKRYHVGYYLTVEEAVEARNTKLATI